ncbi:MAG TPA: hypothetical protein VE172_03005 [Stackebrandtia sp.]|jgi:hypothetical protein|uniref:hypothetical protein n=1 Tax=Stackebrandtia sp. TaxID=2023065 RepID=UPI002D71D976|nr:hypothetical protein [Stackebrandtia sp.]HZE37756.1 hypothetical protein [Stackebrandtia sp.]
MNDDTSIPDDDELMDLAHHIVALYSSKTAWLMNERLIGDDSYVPVDSDAFEDDAEWVVGRFKELMGPSPGADFDAKADACKKMVSMLGVAGDFKRDVQAEFVTGDLDDIDNAMDHMNKWDGALANSFANDYLGKFKTIAGNQGIVMAILANDMIAMRNILAERRRSLKRTGDNAVTALEAIDGLSGSDLTVALSVLSAFLGIVTAGLGAVGSVAVDVGGAVVSGGVSLGSAQVPDDKEMPLGSDDPSGVLDKLKSALDELENEIQDKQDALNKSLWDTRDVVAKIVLASSSGNSDAYGSGQGSPNTELVPGTPKLDIVATTEPGKLDDGLVQFT